MPVITITGLIGTGSPEVGADVARKLGIDFVDRLILAEAAKKLGTTVAAVAERTERAPSLGDRFAGFVRAVLERSALAGGGADPYFGGGLDALLVREYKDFPVEGAIPADGTVDDDLIRVTAAAIREIAASGNVIIAGRGANMILANEPGILHVGLTSRKAQRIERIMERVLALDETYLDAGPHLFMGVLKSAAPPELSDETKVAEMHFDRAEELTEGNNLMIRVFRARYLQVARRDRGAFVETLEAVLESDARNSRSHVLVNTLAQRRARRYLSQVNSLFPPEG